MTETLEGKVTAVIFRSADGVFCVFRLKEKNQNAAVVAAGQVGTPAVGEAVSLRGCWVRHPRFGMQFRVESLMEIRPDRAEDIERYLASGEIEGIGPTLAARIVARFGGRALDVMDENMDALLGVAGIGEKTLARIRASWEGAASLRDLSLRLQSVGVPVRFASALQKLYGEETERVLQKEPYRMVREVTGMTFPMADRIAMAEGIRPDDEARILCGIQEALSAFAAEGHCCVPAPAVWEEAARLLGIEKESVAAIGREAVGTGELPSALWRDRLFLYLPSLYEAETEARHRVGLLLRGGYLGSETLAVQKFEREHHLRLADEQREAVRQAMASGLLIITGGPGTGKTTIIRAIMTAAEQYGKRVRLMAPTGRAAKRLSLASGRNADTIHKALEAERRGEKTFFGRNESEPLTEDLVIVDEASMMDMLLFYRLLCALKEGARLILVGDIDQLPPVGPGAPLKDLIAWGGAPVVRLERIFRQKEGSGIILNAARIRKGELPQPDLAGEFQICPVESEEEAFQLVMHLCRDNHYEGDEQKWNMQVLSPMYRGAAGVDHLNEALQLYVQRGGEGIHGFAKGDKVMQVRNNYEKGVYNGDVGIVWAVTPRKLFVHFPDKETVYEEDERRELQLAYAVTVHKSQGSEYETVILVLLPSQRRMLQRNLLYTGVTRASRRTILITTSEALSAAVRNYRTAARCSLFLPFLAGEVQA